MAKAERTMAEAGPGVHETKPQADGADAPSNDRRFALDLKFRLNLRGMTAGGQIDAHRPFHVENSFFVIGEFVGLGVGRGTVERRSKQDAIAATLLRGVEAGIG